MRAGSIRRHLLLWLLPGFVLLWAGGGSAIYHSVKHSKEAVLDAELREIWAALPFGGPPGQTSPLDIGDFADADVGVYFQIWDEGGNRLLKSENLGIYELPADGPFGEQPVYGNVTIGNGDVARTLWVGGDGGVMGPLEIVVATSWNQDETRLRKLLLAILAAGLFVGIAFVALLSLAVKSALRPLSDLGAQAERIEADRLSVRFPDEDMPAELRPIIDRLNNLMVRLERGFAREKRFGADLAHELRTPVAALRTVAEVALKWPDQADEDDFRDIHEIAERLQVVIENLLTLARLESAGEQLRREPVAMMALVDDCWELHAPEATARALVFRNQLPEGLELVTDSKLVRLIVSNLLSNAVAYAPLGADVLVEQDERVLVFSNPASHLAESDLPVMFDRLWRHDEARTDSSHCGLGLSLARTCADILGCRLDASLEGGWIHFKLRFPDADV